jgi:drug/metabolite transporter (DMT)-like permease
MSKTLYNLLAKIPGSYLIVLAAVLWALDGVLRRSLFSLSPLTIVFFESLIGCCLLLPFFLREQLKKPTQLTAGNVSLIALVALISGLLGTLWFTTALMKVGFISFSVVFLLQKLQPLFAIISARVLLKESLPLNYLKWAGVAIVAAFFVTFPLGKVNFNQDSASITAAGFALGAAAAWGTSTALSKMALRTTSALTATSLRFFFATVFAFIALLLTKQSPHLESILPSQYLTLTTIALSTGMFALYIYYQGLKKTQAKVATILELTFPMLAIFIDASLYKTLLHPTQYLAALFLLFAIHQVGVKMKS